jgi:integrase
MAIDEYLAFKRGQGRAPSSLKAFEQRLVNLLGPVIKRPLRAVIGRGESLYEQVQDERGADTHHNALSMGKTWAAWCVKRRWLRENPFADVEPVGQRVQGADKARLTVDESRAVDAWCRAHADDPGAVVTLGYLLLGMRASELVKRDVRDLDDDGRLLWIGKTKTKAGRRKLRIPDELGAMLVAIAGNRPGYEPLFVRGDGVRWTRMVSYRAVRRVCKAAGVTVLGPQALRRTQATLATEAGETGLAVARHLGHATGEAPGVTHRSYIGRDAAVDARGDRTLKVIQGGKRP